MTQLGEAAETFKRRLLNALLKVTNVEENDPYV